MACLVAYIRRATFSGNQHIRMSRVNNQFAIYVLSNRRPESNETPSAFRGYAIISNELANCIERELEPLTEDMEDARGAFFRSLEEVVDAQESKSVNARLIEKTNKRFNRWWKICVDYDQLIKQLAQLCSDGAQV